MLLRAARFCQLVEDRDTIDPEVYAVKLEIVYTRAVAIGNPPFSRADLHATNTAMSQ